MLIQSRLHYFAFALVAVACTCEARPITDVTDTAFNGAVTVDFPPSELQPGTLSVEFVRSGVTFRLEVLTNSPYVTMETCPSYVPNDGVSLVVTPGTTYQLSSPI
jgi:hypothetical protein